MQSDFEPVFERKFHSYINCIEGVMHTGQRDMIRIRISKATYEAGFRAKDLGEVLYARIKSEFDAVVDKCQVKVITDPAECTRMRHEVAIPMFDKRDERLSTLTGLLPEPCMYRNSGETWSLRCRFMVRCKSYVRAGSGWSVPGCYKRKSYR